MTFDPFSMLDPRGPQASRVAGLWWFAFFVASVVYVATIGALFWALWRGRQREPNAPRHVTSLPPHTEQRVTRAVATSVGLTVVLLLVFLGYDLAVGRVTTGAPTRMPVTIEITGHQWWWEVQYADTSPQGRFTTANEIHIPVGQPVVFLLSADDVIHSFWVPNLGGKKDLVPGHTQSFWLQADTPGVYRGQCAEFCGLQHAKMGLRVIAHAPAEYARWAVHERAPATMPNDSIARAGYAVFMRGSCPLCHAIGATQAGSHAGPDLTHVASRSTLAAGALPNNREALVRWITDPAGVKPGTRMPPNTLPANELSALVAYLETLR